MACHSSKIIRQATFERVLGQQRLICKQSPCYTQKVNVTEWQQRSVCPHGGVLVICERRAWFLHTTDKAEVPCTCASRVMCHFQQLWSLKPAALSGTQSCPKDMTTDSFSSNTQAQRATDGADGNTLTCFHWIKRVTQTLNQDTNEEFKWLKSKSGLGFDYDCGLLLSNQLFYWSDRDDHC